MKGNNSLESLARVKFPVNSKKPSEMKKTGLRAQTITVPHNTVTNAQEQVVMRSSEEASESCNQSDNTEIYQPLITKKGLYLCLVCNIQPSTKNNYIKHTEGKKHAKALALNIKKAGRVSMPHPLPSGVTDRPEGGLVSTRILQPLSTNHVASTKLEEELREVLTRGHLAHVTQLKAEHHQEIKLVREAHSVIEKRLQMKVNHLQTEVARLSDEYKNDLSKPSQVTEDILDKTDFKAGRVVKAARRAAPGCTLNILPQVGSGKRKNDDVPDDDHDDDQVNMQSHVVGSKAKRRKTENGEEQHTRNTVQDKVVSSAKPGNKPACFDYKPVVFGGNNTGVNQPKKRARRRPVCRYFQRGHCHYGAMCRNRHVSGPTLQAPDEPWWGADSGYHPTVTATVSFPHPGGYYAPPAGHPGRGWPATHAPPGYRVAPMANYYFGR